MSNSGRSASLGGVESQTASAVEREAEDANSKPSYVEWEAREMATSTTTGDRTTVAGVVADKLFQKAKFVDRWNGKLCWIRWDAGKPSGKERLESIDSQEEGFVRSAE
jgi:hypothetical protein